MERACCAAVAGSRFAWRRPVFRLYLGVMGSRGRWHLCDHLPGGGVGASYQPRNERRLGKVPPIFLRHLLLHCLCFQARRVEDVCVIGAPKFLGGVPGRRIAFVGAGRKGQLGRVPMRATIGREDRPAHAGEAAHEEGRVALDDEMLRLEPGDIALVAAFADLPEAYEGAHLVDVAPNGFLHRLEAPDVGVGGDLQQIGFGSHPPEHAVEQGEALGIGVAEDGFGALDEFAGNGEGWLRQYAVILGLVPRICVDGRRSRGPRRVGSQISNMGRSSGQARG